MKSIADVRDSCPRFVQLVALTVIALVLAAAGGRANPLLQELFV